MTRVDLIIAVAQASELSIKDATAVVSEILEGMIEGLRKGKEIELRGFGSFRQRSRKARRGRNPKSGDIVDVPAKRIVYFRPGKELKEFFMQGNSEKKQ